MTGPSQKRGFAARPGDAEHWIKSSETPPARGPDAAVFSARLTIDATSELRGRIKIAASRRGGTVSYKLRELLSRGCPPT